MAGAIAYLEKPVDKAKLDEAFGHIRSFIENRVKRLMIVEDDEAQQRSMVELIGDDDIEIVTVNSGEEALEELHRADPSTAVTIMRQAYDGSDPSGISN